MTRVYRLLTATVLLVATGCVVAGPPPGETPALPAPTAMAAQVDVTKTLSEADDTQWSTIYARPGFDPAHSVDLRAVGDVMLGRNVEPLLRRRPAQWLLEPTRALLDGDVVAGNLESPLASMRRRDVLRPGPFRLPADPALMDRLAPFTVLSVANNHALDAGVAGLRDTWTTLQDAGIGIAGTIGAACPARVPGAAASMLAVFAFNAVVDPQDTVEDPECGRTWLDDGALEAIRTQRAAATLPIVVLVHWGVEYSVTPSVEQHAWAERLVAAGADLVLGAHPHVVQPAAVVSAGGRQGFVAFSLGNFVFDQPDQAATSQSVVLRVRLDASGVGDVAAAPVALRDGRPEPLPLDDPAAVAQLAALNGQAIMGTAARQAWRWNGTTFVGAPVDGTTPLPRPPSSADVDLRGDGEPLRITLTDGLAQVWDGDQEVWRNEADSWQVAGFTTGDADDDGRFEALIELWKPDGAGVLRSHPFMVGWRGGKYRVFWGGSAVAVPIQQAAIGHVGPPGNALVVLEGGARPGDPATNVAVWQWQGWNFQQQWRSPAGTFERLALLDLDEDGTAEIVAE